MTDSHAHRETSTRPHIVDSTKVSPGRSARRAEAALILRTALDEILQRDTADVYLETGTERNVRFYERFGFRVREAGVALGPGDVRHWTMIREPHDPTTAASRASRRRAG